MAFEIENGVLKKYIPESDEFDIVVPEGVTKIETGWFHGLLMEQEEEEVEISITLPESIKEVENGAIDFELEEQYEDVWDYHEQGNLHYHECGMLNICYHGIWVYVSDLYYYAKRTLPDSSNYYPPETDGPEIYTGLNEFYSERADWVKHDLYCIINGKFTEAYSEFPPKFIYPIAFAELLLRTDDKIYEYIRNNLFEYVYYDYKEFVDGGNGIYYQILDSGSYEEVSEGAFYPIGVLEFLIIEYPQKNKAEILHKILHNDKIMTSDIIETINEQI